MHVERLFYLTDAAGDVQPECGPVFHCEAGRAQLALHERNRCFGWAEPIPELRRRQPLVVANGIRIDLRRRQLLQLLAIPRREVDVEAGCLGSLGAAQQLRPLGERGPGRNGAGYSDKYRRGGAANAEQWYHDSPPP